MLLVEVVGWETLTRQLSSVDNPMQLCIIASILCSAPLQLIGTINVFAGLAAAPIEVRSCQDKTADVFPLSCLSLAIASGQ